MSSSRPDYQNPKAARPAVTRAGLIVAASALALVLTDIPVAHAQVAEVVVTARKREENIQNIPVAVTAVSGKQIEQFHLTTVEDVAGKTPQLIISRGSSGSG